MQSFAIRLGALTCAALMFSGCVAAPPARHLDAYSVSVADRAADAALTLVGKPYKSRGDSPSGFDCSGLVRYSYLAAGKDVPHGTDALRQRTRPVLVHNMRKGDLLFFNELGKKYSHAAFTWAAIVLFMPRARAGACALTAFRIPTGKSTSSAQEGLIKFRINGRGKVRNKDAGQSQFPERITKS